MAATSEFCDAIAPDGAPPDALSSDAVPADLASPDLAPDEPGLGPGEECPLGKGCREGLACWYMPLIDAFACSGVCESFDDCAAEGFADGCCFFDEGGGQPLPPLCMTEASGLCDE
jgi:hypothetical protein